MNALDVTEILDVTGAGTAFENELRKLAQQRFLHRVVAESGPVTDIYSVLMSMVRLPAARCDWRVIGLEIVDLVFGDDALRRLLHPVTSRVGTKIDLCAPIDVPFRIQPGRLRHISCGR